MTTVDFIAERICRTADAMPDAKEHTQAKLVALKGVGNRAFYRWLERD